jgi:4-amino-4-deoxy-L-arabinose transferase-like glycosyltransferase
MIITLIFGFWSKPLSGIYLSPDSYDYINLAKNFNHEISKFRPPFFSVLLRFFMELGAEKWNIYYSNFQLFTHSSMVLLFFYLFQNLNLSKTTSFILCLGIGFNPSLLYYASYVLADFLLGSLTTLLWAFTLFYIGKGERIHKEKHIKYTLIIGFLCGLISITKPIGVLLFIPITLGIFIFRRKYFLKSMTIIFCLNFTFLFSWEYYKSLSNSNRNFESMDHLSYSINMTAIRAGLVEYGTESPFYNEIVNKKYLDRAKSFNIEISYTMDTQPDFMPFKRSFDKLYTYDEIFSKKILYNAPFKLFMASISNWHSFFTKRCFGPNHSSFLGMPKKINKIYNKIYAYLYRPFLAPLILFSLYLFFKKKYFPLLFVSISIIFYASFTSSILSPHGGELPRYRVWIEYIIWFIAFYPIGVFFDKIMLIKKRT